ncbi:hypothetical protein DEEACLCL_00066 [Salmonella phage CRW-SP2]|nr:hypothetical protein DEEACLCL_00066 [Salmonella phage CRW-SP2]
MIDSVNDAVKVSDAATPILAARAAHEYLSHHGMRDIEDDIKYNFDDHYKVYFQAEGFPKMVAEFWAPWIGGVSWKIEEAL